MTNQYLDMLFIQTTQLEMGSNSEEIRDHQTIMRCLREKLEIEQIREHLSASDLNLQDDSISKEKKKYEKEKLQITWEMEIDALKHSKKMLDIYMAIELAEIKKISECVNDEKGLLAEMTSQLINCCDEIEYLKKTLASVTKYKDDENRALREIINSLRASMGEADKLPVPLVPKPDNTRAPKPIARPVPRPVARPVAFKDIFEEKKEMPEECGTPYEYKNKHWIPLTDDCQLNTIDKMKDSSESIKMPELVRLGENNGASKCIDKNEPPVLGPNGSILLGGRQKNLRSNLEEIRKNRARSILEEKWKGSDFYCFK